MKPINRNKRMIVAAGGTGGHLFPALAVINKLLETDSSFKFLFVGNRNKIEAQYAEKLGHSFSHIPMIGMPRAFSFAVIKFLLSSVLSLFQSLKIFNSFKPDLLLSTGGYVSVCPILIAKLKNIPIVMIEPNSYPGMATKKFSKYAKKLFMNFEYAEKFLSVKNNIVYSGTPVRNILTLKDKKEAAAFFNFDPEIKTILITGGSLGAKSINARIEKIINQLTEKYQVIWQCGKIYINELEKQIKAKNLVLTDFIDRMDLAFGLADLMISRAGASTISEITLYGIPTILIPSPNVAENHQYYNAKSLCDKNAALLLEDSGSAEELLIAIEDLLTDEKKRTEIKNSAKLLSKPNAASDIANEILNILD